MLSPGPVDLDFLKTIGEVLRALEVRAIESEPTFLETLNADRILWHDFPVSVLALCRAGFCSVHGVAAPYVACTDILSLQEGRAADADTVRAKVSLFVS